MTVDSHPTEPDEGQLEARTAVTDTRRSETTHTPITSEQRSRTATRRSVLAAVAGIGITASAPVGTAATPGSSPSSSASDGPFDDPTALAAFVDELLAPRIGETIPGAIVAIVTGDAPVLTNGYGVADADSDAPVRGDDTCFRVGSVGKLVTWTAVMQGVEHGLLDLDTDVSTYLQDSAVDIPATFDEPVTLRQLGTHTAGFESALDPGVVADPAALTAVEELLVEEQPARVRPPGAAVGYSNYGAALAGHVVAEVFETTFEEYVRSAIFEPLEMARSTFAQPVSDDHPGDLAAGHTADGDRFTVADDVYIDMQPAGSMSATATDMAQFMRAHLNGGGFDDRRILESETVDAMHTRQSVRHPAVTGWRYGFHGYATPDTMLSHSGATIHFTSRLVLVPDHDVGIFLAYNRNADGERPAAVVDAILDEYGLQPAPAAPVPTRKSGGCARAEAVAGEYSATHLPQGGPLHVVDLLERISVTATGAGRLVTETPDGADREWIETAPYVFREVNGRDVLAFERTSDDIATMQMSSVPEGVYTPVPAHERRLVTGGVLGGSLAGFALSVFGWGAGRLRRTWTSRCEFQTREEEPDA